MASNFKAPPPGTTRLSSMQFLTARRPSRIASLICAIVCRLGPLMRRVTDCGLTQSSTKVNLFSPRTASKTVRSHVINRIHAMSTASKGQSLHVSSLCSSKSDNVLFGKSIKRDGVDSLLVDQNEGALALAVILADLFLEVDDFLDLLVGECSLCLD